jgi:hypothetical protein
MLTEIYQGLTNPLARRLGLVISTFGLAEIISCMPDGLVKIYIRYWQTCQYLLIFFFLLSAKPEIVVPGSGIRFRYFIFEISGKSSFVEGLKPPINFFKVFYYLHQRFTQCSKWSTSCILFRSCCNIFHPSIKYVIH